MGTVARADVTISKKPTQNMSCQAGVCSPTAAEAMLNVTDLANMLATGDVKVTTGSGATNIVVKASVGWTSNSRLTLDAIQSVEIDKPVMVTGTGAVTVTTNDGGKSGDLIFGDKGNVTFWDLTSSLIVNGNSYTLVGDIATLASDIASNPSGFYALANDYDASVDGTYSSAPIITAFEWHVRGAGAYHRQPVKLRRPTLVVGLFVGGERYLARPRTCKGCGRSVAPACQRASCSARSLRATIIGCYTTGSISLGDGAATVGGLVGQSLDSH